MGWKSAAAGAQASKLAWRRAGLIGNGPLTASAVQQRSHFAEADDTERLVTVRGQRPLCGSLPSPV